MRPRGLIPATLALTLALASCVEDAPPRLDLEVRAGTETAAVKRLVVFLRVGDGAGRSVAGQVFDLEAAGIDLAEGPLELGLRAPSRFSGATAVLVAGCTGAASCRDDPVQAPDCRCDGLIAFGVAKATVSGTTSATVDLLPTSSTCDQDGDLFVACDRGGVATGCCDLVGESLRALAHDCHDAPADPECAGRGCDTRAAHPFKPAERAGEDADGEVQLARHRAWCGDGLVNDCAGEADVACLEVDSDGDGVGDSQDCAPEDSRRFPGNGEICGDGIDQDCNDFDPPCDLDGDGVVAEQDCDDNDPTVFPGADETCGDGIDQDCNGLDQVCLSPDLDGDGFDCPFVDPWNGHACPGQDGLDCDDLDAGVYPGAEERCGDGVDQDCDGVDLPCPMGDGDRDGQVGVASGGTDCDDTNPTIFSGAPDACGDGVDQDCDGADGVCGRDADGDGWDVDDDCDDGDGLVRPWGTEVCNGRDDDCDGRFDEGNPLTTGDAVVRQQPCGDACPDGGPPCSCHLAPWVCTQRDREQMAGGTPDIVCLGVAANELAESCNGFDDDCDAGLDEGIQRPCYTGPGGSENVGICHGGIETCNAAPGAGAPAYGTCDGEVVPEEREVCDGDDNDCDGEVDTDEAGAALLRQCFPFQAPAEAGNGPCRRGNRTCEGGEFRACVGAVGPGEESCNNVDDDCDGTTDEGLTRGCYTHDQATRDVGLCRSGTQTCGAGDWGNCRGQRGPAAEVCDGSDNDCDGSTDEAVLNACGRCGDVPRDVCNGQDDDCDGATDEGVLNACGRCGRVPDETCNGADDDCDGTTDEGVLNACGRCGRVPNEMCNGADDDCDGATDEGVLNPCGACGAEPAEVCNGGDDDCDGRTDEGVANACGGCGQVPAEVCGGGDEDCDGQTDEGVGNACGGCGAVPEEVCGGGDEDCDGQTDEGEIGRDAANCGRCGNRCEGDSDSCNAQQRCVCGNGATACAGRTDTCTDGACFCGDGGPCEAGEMCRDGACVGP